MGLQFVLLVQLFSPKKKVLIVLFCLLYCVVRQVLKKAGGNSERYK